MMKCSQTPQDDHLGATRRIPQLAEDNQNLSCPEAVKTSANPGALMSKLHWKLWQLPRSNIIVTVPVTTAYKSWSF